MKYSNNNVLQGDFDRRKRESNAVQYIAIKKFERAQDRGFIWDGFIISAVVFIGLLGGLLINLIAGA